MSCVSALQKARYSYQPKLPAALKAGAVVKCTEGEKLAAFADKEKIEKLGLELGMTLSDRLLAALEAEAARVRTDVEESN